MSKKDILEPKNMQRQQLAYVRLKRILPRAGAALLSGLFLLFRMVARMAGTTCVRYWAR